MRNKEVMVGILIVSFAGLLLISACGKSSSTAPSEYTISVPPDGDFTVSGGSQGFQDSLVTVNNSNGNPVQGIKVKVYEHGEFGGFYTDNTFSTLRSSPYDDVTNDSGRILVNYQTATFTCSSTETTHTLGYRVQSGTISAVHTDTFTVKKCGS